MALQSISVFLVVGAIAGLLAGRITRGYGFGLIGNAVIGIIGAFVGGLLFDHFRLGRGGGVPGSLIGATAGAIILLLQVRFVRRRA